MQLKTSFKVQSGLYNFADNGGAIGIIDMLVHLPRFAIVQNFVVNALIMPVGVAPASISFGFMETEGPGAVLNSVAYMVPNAPGAFVVNVPLQGVDLFANPIKQTKTTNVVMAIADPGLTAGKLQFTIWYTENVM